jgi:hypothetical protein
MGLELVGAFTLIGIVIAMLVLVFHYLVPWRGMTIAPPSAREWVTLSVRPAKAHTPQPVMRGQKRVEDARERAYDPRMHLLRKKLFFEDWWIARNSGLPELRQYYAPQVG